MGMYDTIKVEVPLPDGCDVDAVEWQTKCLSNTLRCYTIKADGHLYKTGGDWGEDAPCEPELVDDYHGDLCFYGNNVCASGYGVFATQDDKPHVEREYVARFTNGTLQEIRVSPDGGHRRMKHVPGRELSRIWKQQQQAATAADAGEK